jgi:serine/threonine-protein kinase
LRSVERVVADPNDPGDLSAGDELPGGYTIEQLVVQGRTRLIYAARSGDGAQVAVHVLDAGLVDGMGEWFTQAATAREAIQHPSLPRTLAVGRLDDGRPFEVTELLEGTSMREALDAAPDGLDPLAVVHVVNEAAAALDALHGRTPPVVHRTLCPEHLVVLRDTHEVRLLGLFNADRPQFEGVRPGYRSPEELAGVLSLGARADVFSLATVAYELLTGRAAWPHVPELALDSMRVGVRDRVSVLRPVLPTALDSVFERAWSLSPDARHSSAGRFARALRAAVDPLDLAASMASNVFDDRPTAQVPVLSLRVRNNTLLNAGAVAQAIIPRAVVGKVRASENDGDGERQGRSSRPPPARLLRAPVPPGTRPVREHESEVPVKLALPLPEDVVPAAATDGPDASEETPVATAAPSPDVTGPTDVVRLPDAEAETTRENSLPTAPVAFPPAAEASPSEPPDEPTPLPQKAVAPETIATPAPPKAPAAVAALPEPVSPPPPAEAPPPRPAPPPAAASYSPLDPPPPDRRPEARDARLFLDEPTALIHMPAPVETSWTRSPIALAGLFIAHAILIVGVAHAISYALVHRQPVTMQVIQGPSPVCAPCAACPAPVAALPEEVDQPVAPGRSPAAPRVVARPAPARVPARAQIIRSVPDFGRPR